MQGAFAAPFGSKVRGSVSRAAETVDAYKRWFNVVSDPGHVAAGFGAFPGLLECGAAVSGSRDVANPWR
jgi:hypothetical protein